MEIPPEKYPLARFFCTRWVRLPLSRLCPLFWLEPSTNLSNTKRGILGNAVNRTCGCRVSSKFATSGLHSPPMASDCLKRIRGRCFHFFRKKQKLSFSNHFLPPAELSCFSIKTGFDQLFQDMKKGKISNWSEFLFDFRLDILCPLFCSKVLPLFASKVIFTLI